MPARRGRGVSAAMSRDHGARRGTSNVLEAESLLDGRYRIIERLASGGMAQIYRAEDFVGGREVAIKVLSRGLLDALDEEADRHRLRFRREANLLTTLSGCPHVVEFVDSRLDGENWYIVMELVQGVTLRSVVDGGLLDAGRYLQIATQMVRGLCAIHAERILHRDLSPDNIVLIHESGRPLVKFLDFGIGKPIEGDDKVTQMPTIMGTPQYLSPEQTRGDRLSASSDVYSLGVVLYELLTGELPIALRSMAELARVRNDTPVPLARHERAQEIPEELRALIMAALDKDPGRRPTMDEFNECLAELTHRRNRGHDISTAFSEFELRQLTGAADDSERFRPGVVVAGAELDHPVESDGRSTSWRGHAESGEALVRILPTSREDRERRLRHLERARELRHDNIAPTTGFEVADEAVAVSYREVPRTSLADIIARTRGLDAARFLSVAGGLIQAIRHAHGHPEPIIHGALSPWAVYVDDFDIVQVVDFGLTRLASELDRNAPRAALTTWCAPELADDAIDTPPSDVYSLGCLLHHTLTGRPPFDGTESVVFYSHATSQPPQAHDVRPGVPRALSDLVDLCLRKTPEARPTMDGVADLLDTAFARPDEPLKADF